MKRRDFFASSAIVGASLPLGMVPLMSSCSPSESKSKGKASFTPEELGMYSFVKQAPDGKPLKAALIGNGSRGTGAGVQFLSAGNDLSIVALADLFEDRQQMCRGILMEKHQNRVEDDMCFLGFDAYKKVMELDIDVVLIATPTHFHPTHFKAAVEAGKHVFMEKPAAVDPVGIRTVMVAAKQAEAAGLTVITGTQRHHQRDYWEAYIQIKNGAIGDVLSAKAHWNQGAWWNKAKRPEWSEMEYNIRNWFNIKWLSGDHLLDQGVHNIDVVTWLTGMVPEKAVGYGGRARRLTGDIFDFFSVDYSYANNKSMLATARQIDGCDSNVSESVMGTEGVLYTNDGIRIENYEGEVVWKYDYDANPVNNAYNQEHIHLVESIRLNKKINQAEDLAISTMVAILGREAAYTGKSISWEEIMSSDLRYGPTEYAMGPLPDYKEGVAPVPGRDPKAPM
ncbi:MAG: Gfo/Idh/MocA family oxidoreductase [Bacteroides sp.]|nr:Gfo/Idh/MocA family oxidoreductase [Bacteroides sp.]